MRLLIQRVLRAQVKIDGKVSGEIGRGFLVFVGVSDTDNIDTADKLVKKMLGLRIFQDENGKTNLSLSDIDGELLIVSQFTLYADCKKGNRPSFVHAGAPDKAKELYEFIIDKCRQSIPQVETGEFGADMKVELINDGPFTIMLDND